MKTEGDLIRAVWDEAVAPSRVVTWDFDLLADEVIFRYADGTEERRPRWIDYGSGFERYRYDIASLLPALLGERG